MLTRVCKGRVADIVPESDGLDQVEIEVKYSGYIEREKATADNLRRL